MSRDADSFLTLFALRVPKTITKVMDRNGDIIGVFAEEHRVVIPFGDIPKAFMSALVATEDADFMSHSGVSGRGLVRAGWNFVTSFGRRREGASTLTMQLIRTVTAKRQRRLDRKLKEIILARKLEKAYTKKQILELYANEVYFGGGRYGIEAAAQYYFGKSAPQLNVEECALLAGLVQNPNWYNPYNPDPKARAAAKARRNHVLGRMAAEHYLKDAEAAADGEAHPPGPGERPGGGGRALSGGGGAQVPLREIRQGRGPERRPGGQHHHRLGLAGSRQRGRARRAEGRGPAAGLPQGRVSSSWPIPRQRSCRAGTASSRTGTRVRGVILGWKEDKAKVRIGKATLEVPDSAFAWAGKDIQKLLPRGAAPCSW